MAYSNNCFFFILSFVGETFGGFNASKQKIPLREDREMKRIKAEVILAAVLALLISVPALAQTWQVSQLINVWTETNCKSARIAASKYGGFHAVYDDKGNTRLKYRRFQGSAFGAPVILDQNFIANPEIALNGDIHIVWEDWESGNLPGWAKSTNGGQSFTIGKLATWSGCKWPYVAAFGTGNSAEAIAVFGRMTEGEPRNLFWSRHNGTSWSSLNTIGSLFENEYMQQGICRSLADGTVFKSYGRRTAADTYTVFFRRYNGSGWEPEVAIYSGPFFARQAIAVNPAGQVLSVWEQNEVIYCRLYTPGQGLGPIKNLETKSQYPAVCAIPGSNDFYILYAQNLNRIMMRRYYVSSHSFSNAELVSVGIPDAFCLANDIEVAPDGSIFASWEYWGYGGPQQFFNIKPVVNGSTGNISGVVRDQNNNVLPDVIVQAGYWSVKTNSSGQYTLTVPAGTYSVVASKELYQTQTVNNVVVTAGQTSYVNITLTATHGEITGIVRDQNNAVVEGATVQTTGGAYSTTTDGNGRYRLRPVNPNTYEITASKTGYQWQTKWVTVTAGAVSTCDFQITANPGSISGYVRDSANNPISGATVTTNVGGYSATTNSSGYYYIGNVTPRGYNVTASKSGFNSQTKSVTVNPGANTSCSFNLTPLPGAIAGVVRDSSNNAIAGALVTVNNGAFNATAASDGSYTINNVPPGTYSVLAWKNGYRSQTNSNVSVSTGQTTTSNFNLQAAVEKLANGSMEGGFFNTGWPTTCSGRPSQLPNSWGWNNESGIPFNTFAETSIRQAGSASTGLAFCQTASSPGKIGVIVQNINLGPNVSADFVVWAYHTDGNCPSIMAWNPGMNQGNPYTANANGRFQWVCYDNWGQLNSWVWRRMQVTADSSGWVTIMAGGAAHPGTASGAKVYVDSISVGITAGPGAISGYVRDTSNNPISGATVSTNVGGYSTTSASDGSYTLSNVTAGSYQVTASKANFNSQTQNVTVNPSATTTCNFNLTPQPGTISGYVRDASNNPISGATVSTNFGGYSTTKGSNGSYTLSNVAVGTYSVTASKSGYQSQTVNNVSVSSNQTTTVNFNLSGSQPVDRIVNGNMEGGFFNTGWGPDCSGQTSQLPNSWGWNNEAGVPFNTFAETGVKRGGSYSLGFAFCQTAASPGKLGVAVQNVYLGSANATATFTAYAYHTDGNCPSIMAWNPGQNQGNPYTASANGRLQWICTDNWNQRYQWVGRSMTVQADSSGFVTIMVGGAAHPGTAAGARLYIDDVSVITQ